MPADQEFVFVADRFDVAALSAAAARDDDAGDAVVDKELGYLTQIRESLLAFFEPKAPVNWDEGFSDEPATPRDAPREARSFSAEFHSSPSKTATPRGLDEPAAALAAAVPPLAAAETDPVLKANNGAEPGRANAPAKRKNGQTGSPPPEGAPKKPRFAAASADDATATRPSLDMPHIAGTQTNGASSVG